MVSKANMPPGSIARSSAGLREALFQNLEQLRDGTMDPSTATASARVAKQIIDSVRLDLAFAKAAKAGEIDGPDSGFSDDHLVIKGSPEAGDASARDEEYTADEEQERFVRTIAGALRTPPVSVAEAKASNTPPVTRAAAVPVELDVRFEAPKNRRCLRCNRVFLSTSIGNRMCTSCVDKPEGAQVEVVAPDDAHPSTAVHLSREGGNGSSTYGLIPYGTRRYYSKGPQ